MQTSKIFLVTVAATALTCVGQVAPKETEAQAKAREALRQKMEQLGAQPAPVATPSAVAPAAPASPAKPPPPAPAPAPVRVTPPPVVQAPPAAPADPIILLSGEDDEATIRARAAMREKMDELSQSTAGTKARSGGTVGVAGFAPVPPPSQPGAAEMAIQAKMEKLATPVVPDATPVVASPPPPSKPAPVASPKPKPAKPVKVPAEVAAPIAKAEPVAPPPVEKPKSETVKPAKAKPAKDTTGAAGYPPLQPPPAALPPSKEAQLAELLRQYRADEISPAAYHTERARILAAP